MTKILIATTNAGKLRDFAAVARDYETEVEAVPGLASLPAIAEDAPSFEGNARKKAEHYSRFAPGELILADDSGLEVDALRGAPGIHSARYAALEMGKTGNSSDAENRARLLREMAGVADEQRTAHFVCIITAARDGRTLATFRGQASGVIMRRERGTGGFGYDPLFYVPELRKTFAELTTEEKAAVSHRGRAFREFLKWFREANANVYSPDDQ